MSITPHPNDIKGRLIKFIEQGGQDLRKGGSCRGIRCGSCALNISSEAYVDCHAYPIAHSSTYMEFMKEYPEYFI